MYRKLLVGFMVLAPVVLLAQNNDIGVFLSAASYSSTTFSNPEAPGETSRINFDEGTGYGVSYDRFWTPNISTELAYTEVDSDVSTEGYDALSGDVDGAHFWMWTVIAKYHARRFGRTMPYAGGGLAHTNGYIDVVGQVFETDTLFFNVETTWVANLGVAYAATPIVILALDAKYVPYSINEIDGEATEDSIDVNPLMISAGIHWRF